MLRPGTWDRKSQPPTPGLPQPQPGPHLPAGAAIGPPPPPHKASSAPEGSLGIGCWGQGQRQEGPCRSYPAPFPQLECWGLPGKCPSLRAPPRPRRRDRPTDAEKKRERWTDEKKSLNKQKRGTRLCGEGWRAQAAAPSVLLAQLSPGRFVGRCTPRVRRGSGARSRGHWEPILQDTQGCWAGWEPWQQ